MKVIMINGPMGVGKTTVGKRIAEKHPGTAFIDGDWCMDIHPFVGNRETKAMAVDNIVHMIRNYRNCSECKMVVLVWLMDDPWVLRSLSDSLSAIHADVENVTLICDRESLAARWKNDRACEWRTDDWLDISLKSLPFFRSLDNTIDTGALSPDRIADMIVPPEDSVAIRRVEQGSALAGELLRFVENCSWTDAREHIAGMIRAWEFRDWEAMFAAVADGKIVGMASVLKTDYYPLPDIFPWVSCIFVSEEYRGRKISGQLIAGANNYLKTLGFERSYIPTEHAGLYEHYGYRYVRDIVNYGGGTDRLYVREFP